MWKSSSDLMDSIYDAHLRLRTKETDAITAHAEARLLGAATRVLAISLEHARLTNRLVEGSSVLPGMALDLRPDLEAENGIIETSASKTLAAAEPH